MKIKFIQYLIAFIGLAGLFYATISTPIWVRKFIAGVLIFALSFFVCVYIEDNQKSKEE